MKTRSPMSAATLMTSERVHTRRNRRAAALGAGCMGLRGLQLSLDDLEHAERVPLELVEPELDVAHRPLETRDQHVLDRGGPSLRLLDLLQEAAERVLLLGDVEHDRVDPLEVADRLVDGRREVEELGGRDGTVGAAVDARGTNAHHVLGRDLDRVHVREQHRDALEASRALHHLRHPDRLVATDDAGLQVAAQLHRLFRDREELYDQRGALELEEVQPLLCDHDPSTGAQQLEAGRADSFGRHVPLPPRSYVTVLFRTRYFSTNSGLIRFSSESGRSERMSQPIDRLWSIVRSSSGRWLTNSLSNRSAAFR